MLKSLPRATAVINSFPLIFPIFSAIANAAGNDDPVGCTIGFSSPTQSSKSMAWVREPLIKDAAIHGNFPPKPTIVLSGVPPASFISSYTEIHVSTRVVGGSMTPRISSMLFLVASIASLGRLS